jgi:peptide deformylase
MTEDEFYRLVDEMFSLMYDHAGQGLAAPQVGLLYSLFVINSAGRTWTFIDPEILNYGTRVYTKEEGCLSIPGVVAPVSRPGKVKIKYYPDYKAWRNKRPTIQQYDGPMGRVVQHEYDHIEGRLFIDRLPPGEFAKILPQLEMLEGTPDTVTMTIELPFGLPLVPDKVAQQPTWVPAMDSFGPQAPYKHSDLLEDWHEAEAHPQMIKEGFYIKMWGPHQRGDEEDLFRFCAATAKGRTLLVLQSMKAPVPWITHIFLFHKEAESLQEIRESKPDLRIPAPGWTEPLDDANCKSMAGFVLRLPRDLIPEFVRRMGRGMKP